jgi:hypothetical protein
MQCYLLVVYLFSWHLLLYVKSMILYRIIISLPPITNIVRNKKNIYGVWISFYPLWLYCSQSTYMIKCAFLEENKRYFQWTMYFLILAVSWVLHNIFLYLIRGSYGGLGSAPSSSRCLQSQVYRKLTKLTSTKQRRTWRESCNWLYCRLAFRPFF